MSSMIKGIAAKLVSHLFSEYIEKIDSSQLELQIWNGIAKLENLAIRSDALTLHHLPFAVKRGTVGSISLKFPWGNLNTQPCVVDIDDVFVVATIAGGVLVARDLEVHPFAVKDEEVSEQGKWSSLMNKIVDNIEINIRNLHLRVENPTNGSFVAFGVTMKSLETFSVDETERRAFLHEGTRVLRKMVKIDGLALYIDTGVGEVQIEPNFNETMSGMISSNHQYLLKPFSFNGIWTHYRDTPDAQDGLKVITTEVLIGLDARQWQGLNELGKQYQMFNKRRMYSHLGKPDRHPRSERSSGLWWNYANRCARYEKFGNELDVGAAVEILKNRREYLALVRAKDQDAIDQYEEELDPKTILFLRNYAQMRIGLEAKGPELTTSELQEIVKMKPKYAKSTGFHVLMDRFQISISDQDLKPITLFVINEVAMDYVKSGYDSDFQITAQELHISNELSLRYNKTFSSSQMKYRYISKTGVPSSIEFETGKVFAVLDVNWAAQMAEFFKRERLYVTDQKRKKQQIQAAIDQHVGFNLRVSVRDVSLLMPYQEIETCPCLRLEFREYTVNCAPSTGFDAANYESLYETYQMALSGATFDLDGKAVTNTFDGNVELKLAIVKSDDFEAMKLIAMSKNCEVSVSLYQYLMLLEMLFYFLDCLPEGKNKDKDAKTGHSFMRFLLENAKLAIFNNDQRVYELATPKFCVDFLMRKENLLRVTFGDTKVQQYVNNLLPQFVESTGIVAEYSQSKMNITIDKFGLDSYNDSIRFLFEFLVNPGTFETRMQFPVTFDYDSFKHKRVSREKASTPIDWTVTLENPLVNMFDADGRIGKLTSHELVFVYCVENGARRTELSLEEPRLANDSGENIISFTETLHLSFCEKKIQTKMSTVLANFETVLMKRLLSYAMRLSLPQQSDDKFVRYMAADIDIERISGNFEAFTFEIDGFRAMSLDDRMDRLSVDVHKLVFLLFDFEFIRLSDLSAKLDLELLAARNDMELVDVKADVAQFEEQKKIAEELQQRKTGRFWVSSIKLDASLGDIFLRYSHKLLDDAIGLGFKIERNTEPAKPRATDFIYNCKVGTFGLALFDTEEFLNFRIEEILCSNGNVSVKSVTESVIGFIETTPLELNFSDSIQLDVDNIAMKIDETSTYRIMSYISLIPIKISTTERRSIDTKSSVGYQINIGHAQFDFENLELHSRISIAGNHYQISECAINRRQSEYLVRPFDIFFVADEVSQTVEVSKISMNLDVPDVQSLMRLAKSVQKIIPKAQSFTSPKQDTGTDRPQKIINIKPTAIEWCLMKTVTLVLELKPFSLDHNLITTAEVILSLAHPNHSTGNTDMIIEKTRLLVNTDFHESTGQVVFEVGKEFNVNVTANLLDSISHARKCFEASETAARTYSLRNMNDNDIIVDVNGKQSHKVESGYSVALTNLTRKDELKITYGTHFSSFRVYDLCYPMAITKNCVVSLSDGVILISSPYRFQNKFGFPLSLWTKTGQRIAVAEQYSEVVLPSAFDPKRPFLITDTEELISRAEPIEILHWNTTRATIIPTKRGTFKSKLKHTIKNDIFGVITAAPTIVLWNELPNTVAISAKGVKRPFSLLSGKGVDIPRQLLTDTILRCKLTMGEYSSGEQEILIFNKEPQPIVMTHGHSKLVLFGKYESGKFCLFSPCIVKNDCSFPLDVRSRLESKGQTIEKEYLLIGSPEYGSSSKMCISYRIRDVSEWSQPFDCVSTGVTSALFAPVKDSEELFAPIRYEVDTVDKTFEHTRILTFSPELSIVNETKYPITLIPLNSTKCDRYATSCLNSTKVPVLYTDQEFNFELRIEEDFCNICLSSPCRTAFQVGSRMIAMEIVEDGNGRCAHFRQPEFPTPIVISNNLTGIPISVWQIHESNAIEIPQSTTTWFAFDDPMIKDPSIHVSIAGITTILSISSNFERKRLGETECFVDLSTTVAGHRILVVNADVTVPDSRHDFEIIFKLDTLRISIIDACLRELALVQVKGLNYRAKFEKSKHLVEFKIQGLQVDDQYAGAVFPVVISGKGVGDHPFIHLSAVSHRDSPYLQSFSSLCLSVQRIDTFLDLAFVSDIISFMMPYAETNEKSLVEALTHRPPAEHDSAGSLYSFGVLIIHPILLTFTFRGNTRRDFSLPQTSAVSMNMFKFIPSLTSAPIEIPSFTVENFLASKSYLNLVVKDAYRSALMSQVWKLAGHLDIFFNAGGIARTVGQGFKSTFYDPMNANVTTPEEMIIMAAHGGSELIKGTVGSIIKGGEGFVRNISSYVSMLDPDRKGSLSNEGINQSASDTVLEGFRALGTGLFEGLTGLVTKPVEGAEKEGFEGVLSGIGKGLIGLVAKPVSGVLECGAGVLGGVRKAISDEEVIQRIRLPRTCPMAVIDVYHEREAVFQSLATKYDVKNGTLSEILRVCVKSEKGDMWLAVCNRKLFMFVDNEVALCRDIDQVTSATARDTKIVLQILVDDREVNNHPHRFVFNVESPDEARRIVALVNSRRNFCSMFHVM